MPHKHTRKGDKQAHADLPPSAIARPLPAFEKSAKVKGKKQDEAKKQKLKQKKAIAKNGYKEDDTPRAFAQLMRQHTTGKRPSGLDDGITPRAAKKRKLARQTESTNTAPSAQARKPEIPKILPGERLADYAARVDQALPVGGLARRGKGPKIEGMKERQTRTEKRLHKMYAEWREEEARIQERKEEEEELAEEAEEEKAAQYGSEYVTLTQRNRKRKRAIGEAKDIGDDDDDPWKVLKEKREKPKGLHDVVQAPPEIKVVPKEKFKVKNQARVDVANVPGKAGSLKRREELGEARREVIERYRAMMRGKG
jgi:hypothetical protein